MFDIGFQEIVVIGVIALLVIGPERLPGAARTVGLYVGRIRRYVSHVRADIEREINAEELRQIVRDPTGSDGGDSDLAGLRDVVNETRSALDTVRSDLEDVGRTAAGHDAARDEPSSGTGDGGQAALGQAEGERSWTEQVEAPQPDTGVSSSGTGDVADAAPDVEPAAGSASPEALASSGDSVPEVAQAAAAESGGPASDGSLPDTPAGAAAEAEMPTTAAAAEPSATRERS